ncbi:MAG: alpha/beta hydrolase [Thermoleophilaceae bacterium]
MNERHETIAGVTVHWRESPAEGTPVLYIHGVPTDGGDWIPFLERTGGLAPDLPGFGRSDKPPHFDYSIPGYARFLRAFVDSAGLERFSLVLHDWGAVGLALAQAVPDRVERLVLMNAVPLMPGYAWHRIARVWRTPLAGELAMGMTFRRFMVRTIGERTTERAWPNFDHGTQRAILKLYRSSPVAALAEAGAHLETIRAPALIVWGEDDPFIPSAFAAAYRQRLDGELRLFERAGHWPWIERPDVIDLVARFVQGDGARAPR